MRNEEIKSVNLDDLTPESLMDKFKGPGLMKIVMVTVVFHLVVLVGFSLGFINKAIFGEDTSKLSKDERVEKAMADTTTALREIADEYGLNPQDISAQFTKGGSRTVKKSMTAMDTKSATDKNLDDLKKSVDTTKPAGDGQSEQPKSALEKQLEKAVDGPDMPGVDEEEDIF